MGDNRTYGRMQRKTAQRSAIRHAIEHARHALSPHEILDAAKVEAPGLGIATVYRTIKALVHEGEIVPVELPGEPPRYERSGKPHHHHFYCRECAQVYPVEGCAHDLNDMVPKGFSLEEHHVVLYGLCSACAHQ